MNFNAIKTSFCFVLMIAFILMSFISEDVINSQLFAASAIISGALTSKFLSATKSNENQ